MKFIHFRNIFVRNYSRNLPAKNILFNIKITAEGKCPQNIGKNRHLSVADKLNFVPTSTFLPFLLKQKRAAPNLGKETIEKPHDLTRLELFNVDIDVYIVYHFHGISTRRMLCSAKFRWHL